MPASARIALSTCLFGLTAGALAAEFEAGPYLEQNCSRCHGTEIYTRKDRRVNSFSALQAQVAFCDANLGTKLFPEDLELLVDHLNTNYYKFDN
jgi:hypothetical protein